MIKNMSPTRHKIKKKLGRERNSIKAEMLAATNWEG